MKMTARELNRATLQRQMLLQREAVDAAEAVRRVVAIQAQQAASPYVALWNRVAEFDPAQLDAAFVDRTVVKATLVRITLHAVHVDDYPSMHAAMQPTLRGARLTGRRFKVSGLSPADADALLAQLADFTRAPRTNADVEAWFTEEHKVDGKAVWWALRSFAPLWHAPGESTWSFGPRPQYSAALSPAAGDPDDCLPALVRSYLEGFGPATVADLWQFAMVHRPRVRAALAALGDEIEQLQGPAGEQLFDIAGAPRPDEDVAAPPRLMAMWDNILLAYADRSRTLPEEYRKLVIRTNGDTLPTLLVDGYVAGVWRPVDGGIECTAFHPLAKRDWDGLAAETSALVEFLADREPTVYGRYGRWWDRLPEPAEVRVLPRHAAE